MNNKLAIKPLYLLILLAVILLGVLLYIFVRPKSPAADVQPAIPAPLAQNLTYEILATYPHDAACYTQGLVIDEERREFDDRIKGYRGSILEGITDGVANDSGVM